MARDYHGCLGTIPGMGPVFGNQWQGQDVIINLKRFAWCDYAVTTNCIRIVRYCESCIHPAPRPCPPHGSRKFARLRGFTKRGVEDAMSR